MSVSGKIFVGAVFVGFGYMAYQGGQVEVPLSVYSAENKVEALLNCGVAYSQENSEKTSVVYALTAFKLAQNYRIPDAEVIATLEKSKSVNWGEKNITGLCIQLLNYDDISVAWKLVTNGL
ncbi:TPA: hypothetical protein RQK74_004396 [Vibrio vulnificus]|nr:hypothetical protein [Vibrio vulnificus]